MLDNTSLTAPPSPLRLALVAHDARKQELLDWVLRNRQHLKSQELYATGTTGLKIFETAHLSVECLKSGPLGGDQQIGAKIAEGRLDGLFFFWDPMSMQPHDADVKALLRIAVLYNLPHATTPSTADFVLQGLLQKTRNTQNHLSLHTAVNQ